MVNWWNSDLYKKNYSSYKEWFSNCYWFIFFRLIDVGVNVLFYFWYLLDKWVFYSFVWVGFMFIK